MRSVITRVKSARVTVGGETAGEIGEGLCVLLGVARGDTEKQADYMADRVAKMRVFEDENGKMNLPPDGRDILVVSNFTLCADCKKSRRPDFFAAEKGEGAKTLYERFVSRLKESSPNVHTGVFGAEMLLESVNDGPVTFIIDTEESA